MAELWAEWFFSFFFTVPTGPKTLLCGCSWRLGGNQPLAPNGAQFRYCLFSVFKKKYTHSPLFRFNAWLERTTTPKNVYLFVSAFPPRSQSWLFFFCYNVTWCFLRVCTVFYSQQKDGMCVCVLRKTDIVVRYYHFGVDLKSVALRVVQHCYSATLAARLKFNLISLYCFRVAVMSEKCPVAYIHQGFNCYPYSSNFSFSFNELCCSTAPFVDIVCTSNMYS